MTACDPTFPTLSRKHVRHFDARRFKHQVHIVGVGGTGSHMAVSLARMGVGIHEASRLHLWDYDRFEEHNVANQDICGTDVAQTKVAAMRRRLSLINEKIWVTGHNEQ